MEQLLEKEEIEQKNETINEIENTIKNENTATTKPIIVNSLIFQRQCYVNVAFCNISVF